MNKIIEGRTITNILFGEKTINIKVNLKRLNLAATTADANQISISFSSEVLTLKFMDYAENMNKIIFKQVLAYNFIQLGDPPYSDDSIYEVCNSEWLNE